MGATGNQLHFNQALTNMMLDYRPEGLIADMVFPMVNVGKQSDTYLIWSQADAFRVDDTKRAPSTEANLITREVSSDTYFCDNYALGMAIPQEDITNMDAAFATKMRTGKAQYILDKLGIDWDKRVADLCTSTSNVGSSDTVDSAWNVLTSGASDPLGDVWAALDVVEDTTAYRPNKIVFGGDAWRYFRRHADVIDLINGDSGIVGNAKTRLASIEQVKALFEVDDVIIGRAYYNSADEGQAATLSRMWGDNVLVSYTPKTASIDKPSFGYAMRWVGGGLPNMQVSVFPPNAHDRARAEVVEAGYYQDEKVTGSALSFLIQAVTSAQ